MMNRSMTCSPSGDPQAPSPKPRRPGLRVSCSPSPRPSLSYVFSMVGTSRCDVRAACSGATSSNAKGARIFVPTATSRPGTAQRAIPTIALSAYSPMGDGESLVRAWAIRPSLVVVCLRNDGQRRGDCNRTVRVFQHRDNPLPLLGERVGVRESDAKVNPRRTTTPGILRLRESPGRAGGFPIWL